MKRALVLLALCAGCVNYRAGSLLRYAGRAGASRQLGCLELELTQHPESWADGRPVVRLRFGNRCYSDVRLRLGNLRARGRDSEGEPWVSVPLYDPHGALTEGPFDGHNEGEVWLALDTSEYRSARELLPWALELDVSELEPGAAQAPPLCFERVWPERYARRVTTALVYEVASCGAR